MANEKNREPEFTVTDRRKFNLDEILNSAIEEEAAAPAPELSPTVAAPTTEAYDSSIVNGPAAQTPAATGLEEGWESPSDAEQSAQSAAYRESGRHLDSALDSEQPGLSQQIGTASFDRLVALISTQALLLMGALAPEGQQPRVDVVGARQQIDLLDILRTKTAGNLDVKEQSMLDNTLFELRMMFIEIMHAFSKSPIEKA